LRRRRLVRWFDDIGFGAIFDSFVARSRGSTGSRLAPSRAMHTQTSDTPAKSKNAHAAALGRLGGLKGGPARAAVLSPRRRRAIARKAARVRWSLRRRSR
jgi:hypothetical protein